MKIRKNTFPKNCWKNVANPKNFVEINPDPKNSQAGPKRGQKGAKRC